jgi:hypothetical protein
MTAIYKLESENLSIVGLSPVEMIPTEISRAERLASGILVKDVIATKRSWKFTYELLPGATSHVEDGGLGRDDIYALFLAGDAVTLTVPLEDESSDDVDVFITNYSETRRFVDPHWVYNMSFELVEV